MDIDTPQSRLAVSLQVNSASVCAAPRTPRKKSSNALIGGSNAFRRPILKKKRCLRQSIKMYGAVYAVGSGNTDNSETRRRGDGTGSYGPIIYAEQKARREACKKRNISLKTQSSRLSL